MSSRTLPAGAAAGLLLALVSPSPARATNGFFAFGYSTKSKGMGGAGAALPQDSLIVADNPAGLAYVGNRVEGGLGAYFFRPKYSVASPIALPAPLLQAGEVKAKDTTTFAPHVGFSRQLDAKSAVGLAIYANGGLDNIYPASANSGAGTFYSGKDTGVKLQQLFITPTYARKVSAATAVGIGLPIGYQRFSARGLGPLGTVVSDGTPDNLSDNGADSSTGVGVKLGVQSTVAPRFNVAAAYQTKIHGRFDKYSDLFANRGGVDIPATALLAFAYSTPTHGSVALDIDKIFYSKVAGLADPYANLGLGQPGGLGGPQGAGLGWRDVTVLKLGYQGPERNGLIWRAGMSYGRSPVRSSEVLFNILAPATQELHLTTGFTKKLKGNNEITVAAVIAPSHSISGGDPRDPTHTQTIELNSHESGVEVSFAKML